MLKIQWRLNVFFWNLTIFFQSAANLSAYGELLLEASMRQAGSKTTRLLFLFEEMLLIVKQRANSYTCKDYIMVIWKKESKLF